MLIEAESEWVKRNRERYEAGGRSELKEAAAAQWAEQYNFTPSSDPEMDMIIAMGLRDMEDDPEFSHMFESGGGISSNLGGPAGDVGATKSKRQLKRERQRERARKDNQEINLAPGSSLPPSLATTYPLSAKDPGGGSRQPAKKNLNEGKRAVHKSVDTLREISLLAPGVARDKLLDWGNAGIGIANKVRGELEEQGLTDESRLDWSGFIEVTRGGLEIVEGLLALPELAGVNSRKLLATITDRLRGAKPVKSWPAWLPDDFTEEKFLKLSKHVCPAPFVSAGPRTPTSKDLPSPVTRLGQGAGTVRGPQGARLSGSCACGRVHSKDPEENARFSQACAKILRVMAGSRDASRTLIDCELLGVTTVQKCQEILCYCRRPLRIGKDSPPPATYRTIRAPSNYRAVSPPSSLSPRAGSPVQDPRDGVPDHITPTPETQAVLRQFLIEKGFTVLPVPTKRICNRCNTTCAPHAMAVHTGYEHLSACGAWFQDPNAQN